MTAAMDILSFALFALAAVAYARKHRLVLGAAGLLFFPLCCVSLMSTWWALSPIAAIVLPVCTLGGSLVVLVLFGIDVIWAAFGFEATYLTFLCWILCPLAILVDFAGAFLRIVYGL